MKEIVEYRVIGTIQTPFVPLEGVPAQPSSARDAVGTITVDPDYAAGLADLDGFSHIIVLYHLHRVVGYKLFVVPFVDDTPHGIFATRAPVRPNPIGISVLRLRSVCDNKLTVLDVDMLNNTPLLDIKPFYPDYDNQFGVKCGWLEAKKAVDIEKIKIDSRLRDGCSQKNRCSAK